MDAREVRIGNYVDLFGSIATVEHADFLVGIAITKGKPIQLTEDWLVRFGFDKGDFNDFYLADFMVELENENVWYLGDPIPSVDVNQVHQLQNIYFALTGEELTIK